MRRIKWIEYNWHSTTDFEFKEVGVDCESIRKHFPKSPGDRMYYEVRYKDGTMHEIFNPSRVFYEPKKPQE